MATSGEVIERFAEASGFLPSTIDRMLRPLRAAGMVPMGERGRGQSRGHFTPTHYANLIMAFGGLQPSDAADAVNLLRPLIDAGAATSKPDGAQSSDFGDMLEFLIRHYATQVTAPEAISLELCLNPARAILQIWPERQDEVEAPKSYVFVAAQSELLINGKSFLPAVTRDTSISGDLLFLAAELWRGSPRADPILTTLEISPPACGKLHKDKEGTESDAAASAPADENETATPSPARGEDVAALSDQPALTELDGGQQPHPTRRERKSQSPTGTRAGRSPST